MTASPADGTTSLNGLRFHFLDWGTRGEPPTLLLHGGAQTAHSWDEVAPDLARDHHVLALDQRGHGDTEWAPGGRYRRDDFVADIRAFLDDRNWERATLVALSLGGLNSIAFAATHPERIAGLVVVDVTPTISQTGGKAIAAQLQVRDFASFEEAVARAQAFNPLRSAENIRARLRHALRQGADGRWSYKFDLLCELQGPKPHDERSEYRCYHEALEQIELADRLGYDTVWEVEHHFLNEFAHSSAPEVFLAAVAQRTRRIRLGHGVVLLPHKFNHPIRVAERVAALDLLSDGRVEFGTGRSSQFEQAGFEVDTDLSREMWQESLEMIPRMWTEDPFEHAGRFVTVPARSIRPKPLQKPHPPIWMAATSPQSWEVAARNGIGVLGLTIFVSVPQLAERVRAYRAALAQAKPVGKFVNDRVGAFTIVHVAETKEQAVANGGTEAAINYLLYAFRVLGGFADPSGRGMQRDYAELEIKSTPYRDLIAKEYPIIVTMHRA